MAIGTPSDLKLPLAPLAVAMDDARVMHPTNEADGQLRDLFVSLPIQLPAKGTSSDENASREAQQDIPCSGRK
jgi:hypothetical protein